MMKVYVHKAASSSDDGADFKTVVPNAMMRRRMSRIVKEGVIAAALALEGHSPDAILTASAYGCLADSEKFLRSVLESDEELLPPTPFIQSTFNTVGAAIALLHGVHGYNMTYTHGAGSFEAALLDAVMLFNEWGDEDCGRQILAGAVEEMTPTLHALMERLQVRDIPQDYGAYFFRLSREKKGACAEVVLHLKENVGVLSPAHCDVDTLRTARELHAAVVGGEDTVIEGESLNMEVRCLSPRS